MYNPSIDNDREYYDEVREPMEEPKINPSTGISNFARKDIGRKGKNLAERFIVQGEKARAREEVQNKPKYVGQYVQIKGNQLIPVPKIGIGKRGWQKLKYKIKQQEKLKPKYSGFAGKFLQLKRRTGKLPIKDRIKMMRFQNSLEKRRLLNQIQRMKINKQVQLLRSKGILKQVSTMPVRRVLNDYPAYATPEIIGDIDSAFSADISGANDFWGNEEFYNEDFYNEDYWGKEMNEDVFSQLNMKPDNGSPLFW